MGTLASTMRRRKGGTMRLVNVVAIVCWGVGCSGDAITNNISTQDNLECTSEEDCLVGSACTDGACVKLVRPESEPIGLCADQVCAPGTKSCLSDTTVSECVADEQGCGVEQLVACDGEAVCRGAGSCIVLRCETPVDELCGNGIDDDCDGETDEGFDDLGQTCEDGVGECLRTGVFECNALGSRTYCTAQAADPSDERCDGLDNDCDGEADEGFDLMTNDAHCGACDNACAMHEHCEAGQCEPDFVRIFEPGVISLGYPAETSFSGESTEYDVRLTYAFDIQTTEVTQAQWERVMGENPSAYSNCGPDCPVETVGFGQALEFLNALSIKHGLEPCFEIAACYATSSASSNCRLNEFAECYMSYTCFDVAFVGLSCSGYRLPTHAEWELAARAGTMNPTYSDDLDAIAWYANNSSIEYTVSVSLGANARNHCAPSQGVCGPHAVGTRQANALGLYDVEGNVSEWVLDFFPYPANSTDPVRFADPDTTNHRAYIRGSSFITPRSMCHIDMSKKVLGDLRYHNVGLRPVRTVSSN